MRQGKFFGVFLLLLICFILLCTVLVQLPVEYMSTQLFVLFAYIIIACIVLLGMFTRAGWASSASALLFFLIVVNVLVLISIKQIIALFIIGICALFGFIMSLGRNKRKKSTGSTRKGSKVKKAPQASSSSSKASAKVTIVDMKKSGSRRKTKASAGARSRATKKVAKKTTKKTSRRQTTKKTKSAKKAVKKSRATKKTTQKTTRKKTSGR